MHRDASIVCCSHKDPQQSVRKRGREKEEEQENRNCMIYSFVKCLYAQKQHSQRSRFTLIATMLYDRHTATPNMPNKIYGFVDAYRSIKII